MARHLLLLDSTGLAAYRWQGTGPHAEATFTADTAGLQAFDDYLNQRRNHLYYLLADVADEGFQIDELPFVRGGDRDEMLKRKLSQYFYGTSLSLAMSLGRAKSGRRDERFLFAGLTGYSQFEPWLQIMRGAEAQLVGIYSAPFVLAKLVGKLVDPTKPVLLMSATKAGLRQTFFDGGLLRFSRLTQMATGTTGELATACGTEARKIYQYLAGQRMIAREKPLQTVILAHPSHFKIIADRCESTVERQVTLIDLVSEAQKQGLKALPSDSFADLLVLHLLAKKTPLEQFAPLAERHLYRLWQTRIALKVAAGAILASSLIYAGAQIVDNLETSNTNSMLQSEVDLGKRRYNKMLEGLPRIPISYDALRLLTDRYDLLVKRSPGPEPAFQHISRALAKTPKVELNRLEWWIANQPTDSLLSSRGDPNGSVQPAATTPSGSGYAIVTIHAQLPVSMANDHRSQLDAVNSFAETLRDANTQVQVITFPFETESGKSIRSTDAGSQIEPPRFVLRMARKL